MNARMPYTFGDGEIPLECIDGALEVDTTAHVPVVQLPPKRPPHREARRPLRQDGTTLQLGIGEIPTVAASMMSDLRDLRVWSEMISDGVLTLHRAGALDPDRPVTSSFLIGSQELYDWATATMGCRCGAPKQSTIRRASPRKMRALVNAAMQVDLFAQANASYVNKRIHSGFGGQP